MRKIRWGIIGCGRISTTFAAALRGMEDVELTAVAARDRERAERFAKQNGARKAYGSYEEIVRDPEVDVIYIGVPHSCHKDAAILCMEHGKHVLCEKPFSINRRETEEMIAKARENKVFLMEAFWTKFLPVTRKIKEWITEGRLGKIRYISARFCYEDPGRAKARLFDRNLGGGALLDVGIYPIAYFYYLLEELPEEIRSNCLLGPTGVDEIDAVIFRYKSGILAEFTSSICMDQGEDAVIVGEKGKISVAPFWNQTAVDLLDENGAVAEHFEKPHLVNGYEYEAAEVNRCIREGRSESPYHPLSKTVDAMEVMDSIRRQWGYAYPQD